MTVATLLLPPLVPKVAAVAVAPDGVELQLVAGGKVRLGPATDVLAKLVAADTVLTQVDVDTPVRARRPGRVRAVLDARTDPVRKVSTNTEGT